MKMRKITKPLVLFFSIFTMILTSIFLIKPAVTISSNYLCESGQEDHLHSLICLSDPEADIETEEIWKRNLPEPGENDSETIVKLALSQLGYEESVQNYAVHVLDDQEYKKGYTRYGAFHGEDYIHHDWTLMFVSFILHHAGLADLLPEFSLENTHAKTMADLSDAFYQEENWLKEQGFLPGDLIVVKEENEMGLPVYLRNHP